jgi:MFS family permease
MLSPLLLTFADHRSTFTCIGVVPIAGRIIFDLEGDDNKSASVLLVTIWELGEAAGPLLIAPLSEVYGRYPVFNICNTLLIFATLLASMSQSTSVFVFARFLSGCAVAGNVLNPSIIGDMFRPEERGSAMSIIMLAPLLGGAVGPAITGAIAETLGWRQVLWIATGLATACEIAFLTLLRETYKPRVMHRRMSRVQPDLTGITGVGVPPPQKMTARIWESIKRPAKVFSGSFVLQMLSLYGAFEFSCFYVMSTSLPNILYDIYDFSPALSGVAFMTFSKSKAHVY